MIQEKLIDNYILSFTEDERYIYLRLHTFIVSCSSEIICEEKFNMPFYTCNGLLLYIALHSKKKQFYIGFCNGNKIFDNAEILDNSETKTVAKWFYKDEIDFISQQTDLKELILQSIQVNQVKSQAKK